MKIEVIGIIDAERDEVFQEVEDNGFEWDWTSARSISVEGIPYGIESFTMWLDSMDILWANN